MKRRSMKIRRKMKVPEELETEKKRANETFEKIISCKTVL